MYRDLMREFQIGLYLLMRAIASEAFLEPL